MNPLIPHIRHFMNQQLFLLVIDHAGWFCYNLGIMKVYGDYHTHTLDSDGQNTIDENIAAAKQRGLSEIGITDVSSNCRIQGLVPKDNLGKFFLFIGRKGLVKPKPADDFTEDLLREPGSSQVLKEPQVFFLLGLELRKQLMGLLV